MKSNSNSSSSLFSIKHLAIFACAGLAFREIHKQVSYNSQLNSINAEIDKLKSVNSDLEKTLQFSRQRLNIISDKEQGKYFNDDFHEAFNVVPVTNVVISDAMKQVLKRHDPKESDFYTEDSAHNQDEIDMFRKNISKYLPARASPMNTNFDQMALDWNNGVLDMAPDGENINKKLAEHLKSYFNTYLKNLQRRSLLKLHKFSLNELKRTLSMEAQNDLVVFEPAQAISILEPNILENEAVEFELQDETTDFWTSDEWISTEDVGPIIIPDHLTNSTISRDSTDTSVSSIDLNQAAAPPYRPVAPMPVGLTSLLGGITSNIGIHVQVPIAVPQENESSSNRFNRQCKTCGRRKKDIIPCPGGTGKGKCCFQDNPLPGFPK